MTFAEFLSEQLDQRRGLQSKLANKLGVSRSTITAWRHGAKPEFEMCLRIAIHFKKDPLQIFKMVGDSNYEKVYLQFLKGQFGNQVAAELIRGAEAAEASDESLGYSEEDLYPNARHAEVHRELQLLLDLNNREGKAIATMIHLAAKQLEEAETGETAVQAEEAAGPPEPQRKPRRKKRRSIIDVADPTPDPAI